MINESFFNTDGDFEAKSAPVLWFVGLSGSGKSAIADKVYCNLLQKGVRCERLDGDIMRNNITAHLDFSKDSRWKNIQIAGFLANKLSEHGVVVIASFISAFDDQRKWLRDTIGDKFIEIFVNTPIEVCEERDVKGLYKKARKGDVKDFTGISHPFEEPENSDITLNTMDLSIDDSVKIIIDKITQNYFRFKE
jgi:adenylyl-sulfate kinase